MQRGRSVTDPNKLRWRAWLLQVALLPLISCGYLPFIGSEQKPSDEQPERALLGVEISGVKSRLAANIHAHLSLATKPCDTAPAYLKALKTRSQDEAQEALRALGYYHGVVSIEQHYDTACPRFTLTVTAGQRIKLRDIAVTVTGEAITDANFMRAKEKHPLRTGSGLDHSLYDATKQLLEALGLERGYLEGRFTRNELRVAPLENAADVIIEYDSGPRYIVGEVRIRQETAELDEGLVRRFLEYAPGEAYDANLVARFYAALSASDYFGAVDVRPLISSPQLGEIPVEIKLTARQRHKFTAGVGVSTDEGIRTRFNHSNRRINEAGHRLSSEMRASLIEQRLSTQYQIPRAHPSDEWLSVQAGVRREDIDTFNTLEAQVGISETKRRPAGWMETHFINVNHQTFDISSQNETTTLLIPGLRWHKTTSNDALYPTRGYAIDFEVRGSVNALFSDVSFARALLSGNLVYGLPLGLRLLLRGDVGYSWADDFSQLPPSERFFAGGDVSIRGYNFEDLGPLDSDGQVTGGKYLGVASVELEKSLNARWGVAAFADGGNAFGGGRSDGVKVAVGVGLRWRSPIGPARIDLAHPLDDDPVIRLHVRIGPDL
jgi:translocation and assembly module TamA